MINTYTDFLAVLEKNISEHKVEVEKLVLEAKKNGLDTSEAEKLTELTATIKNAIQNKDVESLNKIVADANNINK